MMERSLFSARHCFVENLHDSKKMSDAEFSVLCEWFDFLASGNLSSVDVGVDLIIYLRTAPEVAYERKKSRARKEEEVSFQYPLFPIFKSWINSIKSQIIRCVRIIPIPDFSTGRTIGVFSRITPFT